MLTATITRAETPKTRAETPETPKTAAPTRASQEDAAANLDQLISKAQAAYEAVDFEQTRALALRALKAGGLAPDQLWRMYFFLGAANAALGDEQGAKDAYLRMIAIRPREGLSKTMSPKLRRPFLEAKGQWSSHPEHLSVSVAVNRAAGRVVVTTRDPLKLAHEVAVWVRASPKREFRRSRHRVEREFAFDPKLETLSLESLQYAVALLDEHGNELRRHGTRLNPLSARSGGSAFETGAPKAPTGGNPRPYYLAAGIAAALGVAAIGGAIPFHVERQKQAATWNGPGCEVPGQGTRAHQCPEVDQARRSAEARAVLLYAAGGALLGAALVTYLLAPGGDTERADATAAARWRCGLSSGGMLALSCRGAF